MSTKIPSIDNISEVIRHYAKTTPTKPYLISNDRIYTYSEIDKLIDGTCTMLEKFGLTQGEIVSIILKNSIEYVLFYLATLRIGCIINPYPYNLESNDVIRYLENINSKLLFCHKAHYEHMKNSVQRQVILVDDDFLDKLDGSKKHADFKPEQESPACIYYSSGTTANPKSVVFSHKNMLSNISSVCKGFKFNEHEKHLIILPMGHTASVNYSFLPCTLLGGTLVITESFWKIKQNFWNLIKKFDITYVEVVPSILVALLHLRYELNDYSNIKKLKFVGCGSAPLPIELQNKIHQKFGLKVANLYGLSETGPTHVDYPLDKYWVPGSIGKPLDVNQVSIMDENEHILEHDQVGEIVIKGENVFIGYYNNQEIYNQVVLNGFFHTGDLGYKNEDGIFYFTGRKKDLIIKGGINISPDEIDEIIFKLDGVKEATTVGKEDEYLGEKIITYIVLKDGKKLDGENVKDFCAKFLSKEKIPDIVKFVQSLPKGPSGKILRRKMRN